MDDIALSRNALLGVLQDGERTSFGGIELIDLHTHQSMYEVGQAMNS